MEVTMNCRRHGSKPTIALWMLIAAADVALLTAAAGPLVVLLTTLVALTVVGAFVATRLLTRDVEAKQQVAVRTARVTDDRFRRRA
jgi:membrane protein implicated in regulation of membrane protease activity